MSLRLSEPALAELPAGVAGPAYDRAALRPGIVHIGVGNFHRAHMQVYCERLFDQGRDLDFGIVGAGVRPADAAMRDALVAQDGLTTVVELDPSGLSARVVGAMIDFVEITPEAVIAAMAEPSTRIVSLTVTEGGWYVDALTGGFDATHPDIAADAAAPDAPRTAFGMILAALRRRREAGLPPFTVLSCDNLPENGHVAAATITGLARLQDDAFAEWVGTHVAFPNSMVDCITPATSDRERALVRDRFGLIDAAPVACEPFRQWVIEDRFPLGRPAWEAVGAEFVADVAPYELMKLRILNGGHAAIAYPSGLLGHHFVHEAMADPRIAGWLHDLTVREIQPTLAPIPGVDYDAYRETVAGRFANPEVGDTVRRLALDGSNRQPKFILPTVRDALAQGRPVDGLALEVALWCRYCAGTTEAGEAIAPNDPAWEALVPRAQEARSRPQAWLENVAVFGGLGDDPRFAEAFAAALQRLWSDGVAATLDAWRRG